MRAQASLVAGMGAARTLRGEEQRAELGRAMDLLDALTRRFGDDHISDGCISDDYISDDYIRDDCISDDDHVGDGPARRPHQARPHRHRRPI